MQDLQFAPAHEIAAAVRRRALSPVEVMQATLGRLERLNPALNAFVALRAEAALDDARVLEARIAKGEDPGVLAGVPFAVKDEEDLGGFPTTHGSAPWRTVVAERDSTQVARARAAGAEAWIAFGLPQDAAEMVKTFRRLRDAPRLFVAQGAADPDFIKRVGQDAEYTVAIAAYERRAATRGNAQFVLAYAKKWSAEPGLLAAEGYAAAKVLEEAVRRAGGVETDKLRETLEALETETPLGGYKVDRTGAQIAARPLLVQIIRGRREIVWPEALATGKLQPYPAWDARKPLK